MERRRRPDDRSPTGRSGRVKNRRRLVLPVVRRGTVRAAQPIYRSSGQQDPGRTHFGSSQQATANFRGVSVGDGCLPNSCLPPFTVD